MDPSSSEILANLGSIIALAAIFIGCCVFIGPFLRPSWGIITKLLDERKIAKARRELAETHSRLDHILETGQISRRTQAPSVQLKNTAILEALASRVMEYTIEDGEVYPEVLTIEQGRELIGCYAFGNRSINAQDPEEDEFIYVRGVAMYVFSDGAWQNASIIQGRAHEFLTSVTSEQVPEPASTTADPDSTERAGLQHTDTRRIRLRRDR